MRQIEERMTVIAPGAIVRLKREYAPRLADLMARWRVLGVDEDILRVEDVEDLEDTRTFPIEHVERVSGGREMVDSVLLSEESSLRWPEHGHWPACIREESSLFDDPEALEDESLFDWLGDDVEDDE